jgi:hypothetical protein
MSLRKFLTGQEIWGVNESQSAMIEFDVVDALFRQEFKRLVNQQVPHTETRTQLLLMARRQQELLENGEPIYLRKLKGRELQNLHPHGHEILVSYLALAFQTNHIRLVA